MLQPKDRNAVAAAVSQYGVAPGARKMMDWEEEAAEQAIATGLYVTYRSSPRMDCTRVGPNSKCFCGHLYSEHSFISKKSVYPRCHNCECTGFQFIPRRPEEVGDWWLVRRKGFNVHTWRAKCRCGHSHEEHHPVHKRCRCGCPHFQSNFACLACDKLWEDHETHFESTADRMAQGLPVGEAFRPLVGDAEIRGQVFPGGHGCAGGGDPSQHAASGASSFQPNRLRPAAVPASRAEKSVQIMHESSGGRIKGQDTVNAFGKVAHPPQEWLYGGSQEGQSLEGYDGRELAGSRGGAGGGGGGRAVGLTSGPRSGRGGAGRERGAGAAAGGQAVPTARPKQSLGAMLLQSGQRLQDGLQGGACSEQGGDLTTEEEDEFRGTLGVPQRTAYAISDVQSQGGRPGAHGVRSQHMGATYGPRRVYDSRRGGAERESARPGSSRQGAPSPGFKAVYD